MNTNTRLIKAGIFLIIIIIPIIILSIKLLSVKKLPFTASIDASPRLISPYGRHDKVFVNTVNSKYKSKLTITYNNNTSYPLTYVELKLQEPSSSDSENFHIATSKDAIVNILSYKAINDKEIVFGVSDVPPHSSKKSEIFILADHPGKTSIKATFRTREYLEAETNEVSIEAK